jgi:pilus assembly protein CpaC
MLSDVAVYMGTQMWRKTLALISAVITGASIVASSAVGQTRVVTSDATAQFVPLEVGKFIVIDLPVDAKDVLVAKPAIANVVMRTARRAYVLANSAGQTNIAFFDATRRQIEAFDLSVQTYPVHANPPPGPAVRL